jgi:DnaJ-domain-containing protein 1
MKKITIEPDPVIEFYKKDVDRTLIRENLKLTVEQRFLKLMELQKFAEELRRAGNEAKPKKGRAYSHLGLVDKSMFEEILRQMRNLIRLGKS